MVSVRRAGEEEKEEKRNKKKDCITHHHSLNSLNCLNNLNNLNFDYLIMFYLAMKVRGEEEKKKFVAGNI
jgi:hypothetical protein